MTRLAMLCLAALPCGVLAAGSFTLESAEVKPNSTIAEAQVFKGFGCEGGNVSPSLIWKNAPVGAKSFAITVYDPDAPTGSGWWHWVVFNIPADVTSLPKGVGNPASGQTPVPHPRRPAKQAYPVPGTHQQSSITHISYPHADLLSGYEGTDNDRLHLAT